MNANRITEKAQAEAEVANGITELQKTLNIDRETARLLFRYCSEHTLVIYRDCVKAGAEKGPFGMLEQLDRFKAGANYAIAILKEHPDL